MQLLTTRQSRTVDNVHSDFDFMHSAPDSRQIIHFAKQPIHRKSLNCTSQRIVKRLLRLINIPPIREVIRNIPCARQNYCIDRLFEVILSLLSSRTNWIHTRRNQFSLGQISIRTNSHSIAYPFAASECNSIRIKFVFVDPLSQ